MDEELYVDHYDGNTLNNRIGNLRLIDVKGNGQNRKKNYNNLSGITGVYFILKVTLGGQLGKKIRKQFKVFFVQQIS